MTIGVLRRGIPRLASPAAASKEGRAVDGRPLLGILSHSTLALRLVMVAS